MRKKDIERIIQVALRKPPPAGLAELLVARKSHRYLILIEQAGLSAELARRICVEIERLECAADGKLVLRFCSTSRSYSLCRD